VYSFPGVHVLRQGLSTVQGRQGEVADFSRLYGRFGDGGPLPDPGRRKGTAVGELIPGDSQEIVAVNRNEILIVHVLEGPNGKNAGGNGDGRFPHQERAVGGPKRPPRQQEEETKDNFFWDVHLDIIPSRCSKDDRGPVEPQRL
jgi:hypothetical protein